MRIVAFVFEHSICLLVDSVLLLREDRIVPLFFFVAPEMRVCGCSHILYLTWRVVSICNEWLPFSWNHICVVVQELKYILDNERLV